MKHWLDWLFKKRVLMLNQEDGSWVLYRVSKGVIHLEERGEHKDKIRLPGNVCVEMAMPWERTRS